MKSRSSFSYDFLFFLYLQVDQLGVELKESQAALNTAKSEVQSLELKLEEAKRGEETAQVFF